MTDIERLDERLTAVERAVVDGDFELDELADVAAVVERVERLESRFDDLEQRVADLEAQSQALSGHVSNVRSVNEDVEQQADAAIAAVDRLERRLDEIEDAVDDAAAPRTGSSGPARSAEGTARHVEDPPDAEGTVDEMVSGTGRDRTPGRATDGGPDAGGSVQEADQSAIDENFGGGDATAPDDGDDDDDDDGYLGSLLS